MFSDMEGVMTLIKLYEHQENALNQSKGFNHVAFYHD